MPAVSSIIAAAAFAASAVGTVAQQRAQKKQAKSQAAANKRAEDKAEVESKRVQAAGDVEETDIDLESEVLAGERAVKGSSLMIGSQAKVATPKKTGVKL